MLYFTESFIFWMLFECHTAYMYAPAIVLSDFWCYHPPNQISYILDKTFLFTTLSLPLNMLNIVVVVILSILHLEKYPVVWILNWFSLNCCQWTMTIASEFVKNWYSGAFFHALEPSPMHYNSYEFKMHKFRISSVQQQQPTASSQQ